MKKQPKTRPKDSKMTKREGEREESTKCVSLDIGRGEKLILPRRKTLVGGLKVPHFFSKAEIHPYDQCNWKRVNVSIMDYAKGKPSFQRENVEIPEHWSDNSVRITAAKYLFGSEPGQDEYEDSLRHPFDRIANTYTVWGWENGYFAELEDAKIYNWELKALLVGQIWAPNSPVWFNIGHWEQWRWGRPDLRERFSNRGNKAYKAGLGTGGVVVQEIPNSLEHPQASACFLTELDDCMESILGHGVTEGRVFSSGSGVGVNLSKLRSSFEPIAGRGKSSGPMSFNKGWDRMAGAIKSGGRSRRAARMVILDSNHPDIFSFIGLKNSQEQIAKIVLREHNSLVDLSKMAEIKLKTGTDAEKVGAGFLLSLPLVNDKKYDGSMDGEIYGDTVSDQNANHSVSLRGDFWKAYWAEGNYSTRWVTNPSRVHDTFKASQLLESMAEAVYDNAEPGCHNNDFINLWSPIKSKGRIDTSNPCSEYLHANNTSCNLSSFNAYRFLRDGTIDTLALRSAARLAMIAADLNVEEGGFPIPEIAEGTYRYRTTGIGFGNIGGLLMSLGIPYDSDEGRYIAALLTSDLTASCWRASAEMAQELGAYEEWENTKQDLEEVLNLHKCCRNLLGCIKREAGGGGVPEDIIAEVEVGAGRLPQAEGLVGTDALKALFRSFRMDKTWDPLRLKSAVDLEGSDPWEMVDPKKPMRNSFVSLYAPMGTISAPLGIYDEGTTSAEPDYTLVKYKSLSGGGSITMFNSLALRGMETMGYDDFYVKEAALEVAGINGLAVACRSDFSIILQHLRADVPDGKMGLVRATYESFPIPADARIEDLIKAVVDGKETIFPPEIINGKGNVEGIHWMSTHHKEVFDCAATTGGGSRAIAPEGHIRMLGALAPFISGAVSKTVNLPHYADKADILRCFEMSHQMGVKCIALYRADSKGISVYLADSPEANRWKADSIWSQLNQGVVSQIDDVRKDASKPRRKKLPGQRAGQIVKFDIGGTLDGFLIIGTYPDGRCGEVFGRLGRCGSFAHGMFESFCKAFSVMLQWGVPLDKAIASFKNLAFDPAGFARVGEGSTDSDVKSCKSVVDLMMRILEWLFPANQNFTLRGGQYRDFDGVGAGITVNFDAEQDVSSSVIKHDLGSAEMCPECHSLSVIQDGRCKRCINCGFSDGGCGG